MKTLLEKDLELFVVELSLDGMAEFHDKFRVAPGSFDRAMQTYEALAELQSSDSRLRIHLISTGTDTNTDEIKRLSTYLFDRCPKMDRHNLAIIRGDRKNPHFCNGMKSYISTFAVCGRTRDRPLRLHSGTHAAAGQGSDGGQADTGHSMPCAGKLSAVVYANGDVSVCEIHKPLGNLRQETFWQIWNSEEARTLRQSIARKDCYCTTEVFMWPSIVFQPTRLAQAMLSAKVWQKPKLVSRDEKVNIDGVSPIESDVQRG